MVKQREDKRLVQPAKGVEVGVIWPFLAVQSMQHATRTSKRPRPFDLFYWLSRRFSFIPGYLDNFSTPERTYLARDSTSTPGADLSCTPRRDFSSNSDKVDIFSVLHSHICLESRKSADPRLH